MDAWEHNKSKVQVESLGVLLGIASLALSPSVVNSASKIVPAIYYSEILIWIDKLDNTSCLVSIARL